MKDSKFKVVIINDKTNAIINTTVKARTLFEAIELAESQYKNNNTRVTVYS